MSVATANKSHRGTQNPSTSPGMPNAIRPQKASAFVISSRDDAPKDERTMGPPLVNIQTPLKIIRIELRSDNRNVIRSFICDIVYIPFLACIMARCI